MVHDGVGSSGGTGIDAVLRAPPRDGVPLLQQALNLFESGPRRGLGDDLGRFTVVGSLGEAA